MSEVKQSIKGNDNTQLNVDKLILGIGGVSSTLAAILPQIVSLSHSAGLNGDDTIPYDIDEKISYNNVGSFKEFIKEYFNYGHQIDQMYSEYNEGNPGTTKMLFNYFKNKYLLKKVSIVAAHNDKKIAEIDIVRSHADKILLTIVGDLVGDLKASNNLTVPIESLETCSIVVVCHAFIACKILEKPTK